MNRYWRCNLSNADLIRDLQTAMQARSRPAPYDAAAVVTRVDGSTVWVKLAGSDIETPIKRTIDAKAGDSVQVRVSGGAAWINGNQTAPPTDDTLAKEAKQKAEENTRTLETTTQVLEGVQKIAGNTNQYFWHVQSGGDTGAHITEKPQEEFVADPDNGGGNLLARSNGIAVRNGLAELATFDDGGVAFYDGNGSATENVLASFGDAGLRIGRVGHTNIKVAPTSVTMTAPDGSVALKALFELITTTGGAREYGVRITDEHNMSTIIIRPVASGGAFTDELAYSSEMNTFNWHTSGASLAIGADSLVASVGTNTIAFTSAGDIKTNGQPPIYYEDVSVTVSFAAGTIGTRGAAVSCGGSAKTGYSFVGAFVLDHQNTTTFNVAIVRNASNNIVYLLAYRASGNAVTDASVTVRKVWARKEVIA